MVENNHQSPEKMLANFDRNWYVNQPATLAGTQLLCDTISDSNNPKHNKSVLLAFACVILVTRPAANPKPGPGYSPSVDASLPESDRCEHCWLSGSKLNHRSGARDNNNQRIRYTARAE